MLIGGFFDAHHAAGTRPNARMFAALLEEQDVDIMAWAIGTAEPPERFAGPMMEALQRLDYIRVATMSDTAPARPRRHRAADPRRRTARASCRGSRRDLARAAHGIVKGGRAVVIAADEAAMRALADTVPLFAPEVEVLTLPGVGLPALRPRVARAAGDGRAAGDAERAAGQAAKARNCWSRPPMPRPSAC